jgi:hypothetical protein
MSNGISMNLNQQDGGGSATIDYTNDSAQVQTDLPPHLVPLGSGRWALWRTMALRGAGFPAAEVFKLSAPETASIADRLIEIEAEIMAARSALIDSLKSDLKKVETGQRQVLNKAMLRIRQGRMPELPESSERQRALMEKLSLAGQRLETLTTEFRQSFEMSLDRISSVIRELASGERFHEAIVWQNRNAYQRAAGSLLRQTTDKASRNSMFRQHEELFANYLQRYCVKNDTIGFFGPVGWADFSEQDETITVRPGATLLATRNLFFESWGVDLLSATLAQNSSLKPWTAPRVMPFIYVQQGVLYLPGGVAQKINASELTVLQECDGERTAKELAAGLVHDPAFELKSEDAVYALLDSLKSKGLIAWTLEVPLGNRAERELRKRLDRIGDEPVRRAALERVDELEAARNAIAAAAGDAEKLDHALNELDETFSRLTGEAPTRGAGQSYAGRTLVYEDCRRDVEVTLGPEILKALEQPFALLLDSARWITYEVSERYRKAFQNIYAELVKKTGSPIVSATEFWMKADAITRKGRAKLAEGVVPDFQKRWAEILSPPLGEKSVAYTTEQLEPRVKKAFAAPRPGWHVARYHSPDLMIAATGPEAIRRGDYQLVLGEMHIASNNLNTSVFIPQHVQPEKLYQAIESDLPDKRLVLVPPKYWPELTARTSFDFVPSKDYRLLTAHDSCGIEKSRALPIGSLVVEATGGGLVVRTRDNSVRFDIIEAFAEMLIGLSINFFNMLPPHRHAPRITIDRLIVCRETWRFTPSELQFAFEKDEAARFLAVRRWRREQGLPRFLFFKSKIERKPCYLDLDSPIYINIFSKIIRRTKESSEANSLIALTEMIPDHEQAWLPDIEGNRYTSELRLVAVDAGHTNGSSAR